MKLHVDFDARAFAKELNKLIEDSDTLADAIQAIIVLKKELDDSTAKQERLKASLSRILVTLAKVIGDEFSNTVENIEESIPPETPAESQSLPLDELNQKDTEPFVAFEAESRFDGLKAFLFGTRCAKLRTAAIVVNVPLLLMGSLTLLAFRGIYVAPIYTLIAPMWQPWMASYWFLSICFGLPIAFAAAYYFYICRSKMTGTRAFSFRHKPKDEPEVEEIPPPMAEEGEETGDVTDEEIDSLFKM